MNNTRIVQLATAADGAPIADALRAALGDLASLSPDACPDALPAAHENAVLVFVLTPDALTDPAVAAHAAHAASSRFPCLPVVETRRDDFDFRRLTGDFAFLGRLNSVGRSRRRAGFESSNSKWSTFTHRRPPSGTVIESGASIAAWVSISVVAVSGSTRSTSTCGPDNPGATCQHQAAPPVADLYADLAA